MSLESTSPVDVAATPRSTGVGLQIEDASIVVDTRRETNIPGIFAAGDITTYPGKLMLIAVGFGEAPTAVHNAKVYWTPAPSCRRDTAAT